MSNTEIFARIKEYLDLIKQRWLLLSFIAIILASGFGLYAYLSPSLYYTYATFHPDTGNQAGMNTSSPLSFIFGNDLGDTRSNQMIGVLSSRRLSEMVAADSVIIDDKLVLLADIIREQSQPRFSFNRLFQSKQKEPGLNRKIVSAGKIIKSKLEAVSTDAGFIKMDFSFFSVKMTEIISHAYINALQKYYLNQKTEKARKNFNFYTHLSDSVKNELDKAAARVALFEDRNKNLVLARKRVAVAEDQIKLANLQEMYKALILNREQARSQLLLDTPVIQILDYPNPPYNSIGKSVLIYSIIGFILGLSLGVVFITRTFWIEDIKTNVQQLLADQQKTIDNPIE